MQSKTPDATRTEFPSPMFTVNIDMEPRIILVRPDIPSVPAAPACHASCRGLKAGRSNTGSYMTDTRRAMVKLAGRCQLRVRSLRSSTTTADVGLTRSHMSLAFTHRSSLISSFTPSLDHSSDYRHSSPLSPCRTTSHEHGAHSDKSPRSSQGQLSSLSLATHSLDGERQLWVHRLTRSSTMDRLSPSLAWECMRCLARRRISR